MLPFRKLFQLGYPLILTDFKIAITTWPIKTLIKKLTDLGQLVNILWRLHPLLMSAKPHKHTVQTAST